MPSAHPWFRLVLAATVLLVARNVTAMQILVPAYFYADAAAGASNPWQVLTDNAGTVPITAILNPASGPGTALDANYTRAIDALRSQGGRVIAYVSTVYGTRDPALVREEIQRYADFYSLDGYFLDEMSNLTGQLDYYRGLHAFIKTMDSRLQIVGNAGTNTLEDYLAVADTLVTFENATGYDVYQPDAWVSGHPAERFAHLLYDVADAAAMQRAVALAAQRNVGYLYVTDDRGANPWDTLPSYWQAEVAAVSAVPVPGALGLLAGALAALVAWFRRR